LSRYSWNFLAVQGSPDSPNQKNPKQSRKKDILTTLRKENVGVKGDKKGINLNSAPYILSKNDHAQKNLFFPEGN